MGLVRTLSARSMPIFMVPADDGHVPHAPWQPQQTVSSCADLASCNCTISAAKGKVERSRTLMVLRPGVWRSPVVQALHAVHAADDRRVSAPAAAA